MSRSDASLGGVITRTALAGVTAGLLVGLLDLALTSRDPDAPVRALFLYTISITSIAGAAAGLAFALLVALGRPLAALLGGRRFFGLVPLGAALAAVHLYFNGSLFEGPWVREQSWAGLAKMAVLPGGALAVTALTPLLGRVLECGPWRRLAAACLTAAAVMAMAYGNLRLFDAYPRLKLEFAFGTWLATAATLALLLRSARSRPRLEAALAAIMLLAAITAGAVERRAKTILNVRADIAGLPVPAASRVMLPVERVLLERLVATRDVFQDSVGPARIELARADGDGVARRLDELIPARRDFNVVWIAVDALRADHLGCYGYQRPVSPRIDELAGSSVVFERALTPTPASNYAYSATLNGLGGRISPAYYAYHRIDDPTPEGFSFPAELRRAGRATAALTAFHGAVQDRPSFRGFADGFDVFNPNERTEEVDGRQLTDEALTALDQIGGLDRPFFLWLHYMEPHGPYTPRDGFDFGRQAMDVYDAEIAYCDREIGRFLDGLEERGLADDTIVVLFGDHGESFGEHNCWRHGTSLYQHQVHVPLLIRVPGIASRSVRFWVSLSDLVPTMFGLLGYEDPRRRLGRDLSPLLLGEDEGWVDSAYCDRPGRPDSPYPSQERGVWSGDLELLWNPSAGTYQVFDLAEDPGEKKNIFDADRAEHRKLVALLRGWDELIDSFWGQTGDAAAAPPSVADRFPAAVTQVAEATGPDELGRHLKDLVALLRKPPIRLKPELRGRLDSKAVGELGPLLHRALAEHESAGAVRDSAVRLLIFLDDESAVPALRQAVAKVRNRRVVLEILHFLARHGDATHKPILEVAYEKAPLASRIEIAASLALLGDGRGRGLLRAALSSPRLADVVDGVRGLAALGDPLPYENALFNNDLLWRKPELLDPVGRAAARDRTAAGAAVLLHVAHAGGRRAGEQASAELRKRFGDAGVKRMDDVYGAVFGARESIRYRRYDDAMTSLEACRREDDPFLGPLWWLKARAAWRLGRVADAKDALERLRVSCAGLAPWTGLAAATEARLDGFPLPPRSGEGMSAEVVETVPATRGRGLYLVTVELKNGSDGFVAGGCFPDSWQIGLSLSESKKPARGVHLPLHGIEPGGSARIGLIGRLPAKAGRYTPHVVLYGALGMRRLASAPAMDAR